MGAGISDAKIPDSAHISKGGYIRRRRECAEIGCSAGMSLPKAAVS